ncbi:hypothetical protein BDR05DRAFT_1004370 [Suillus weaverae]|nr:hypothetical protein BDR05DRAFT_1004370 [Suillus weaverae]
MSSQGGSSPQWRLNHAFTGQLKKMKRYQPESQDTDVEIMADEDEGEDSMDTDGSWSQQSFQTGKKQSIMAVKSSDEKNWEHLFRSVYYKMHNKVKVKSTLLPFDVLPELRYWSLEFSTIPVPDLTNAQKPDLVLMDYRLKKLGVEHKSWADVLTGVEITISELTKG